MRDNASAASLSHPDMGLISQVNSEMNDKCLDCLGDFSVIAFNAAVRVYGLPGCGMIYRRENI